jgi:hypothetical protein
VTFSHPRGQRIVSATNLLCWSVLHSGIVKCGLGYSRDFRMGGVEAVQPQVFPGTYQDEHGLEKIVWQIGPSRHWGPDRFDIRTVIRSVVVRGADFDSLEPHGKDAARRVGMRIDKWDTIERCLLTGEMPGTVEVDGERRSCAINFRLKLPGGGSAATLEVAVDEVTYRSKDAWFEEGLLGLERRLPEGLRLVSCVTCLFSDYSPYGHGLTGMWCHRDARDQYLAARSKDDYFDVPVTEQVPETYLCSEYERRIPGTGYRG